MKTSRIISIALFAVAAAATFGFAGPFTRFFRQSVPEPELQWRTDLSDAHQEAVLTNRPMLVVFDADWCAYCRKMDQKTLTDASLVAYINDGFIPVRLNLDDNERVAEILEVKRIPCTIALSPRADLLGRVVGYVNTVQYRETLARVRALQGRVERKLAAKGD